MKKKPNMRERQRKFEKSLGSMPQLNRSMPKSNLTWGTNSTIWFLSPPRHKHLCNLSKAHRELRPLSGGADVVTQRAEHIAGRDRLNSRSDWETLGTVLAGAKL